MNYKSKFILFCRKLKKYQFKTSVSVKLFGIQVSKTALIHHLDDAWCEKN